MRFEHKAVYLPDFGYSDMSLDLIHWLNNFGADGWELVAVEPANMARPTRLWFKRKVEE